VNFNAHVVVIKPLPNNCASNREFNSCTTALTIVAAVTYPNKVIDYVSYKNKQDIQTTLGILPGDEQNSFRIIGKTDE